MARSRQRARAPSSWLAEADLRLFRRVAGARPTALDQVLPRLSRTADHGVLWIGVAGVLALTGGRRGRRAALRGLLSLGIASFASNVPAKLALQRERPPLWLVPPVRHLARVPLTWSLPSGHSASAAAFTTGVALEHRGAAFPVGVTAFGVGLSRVYTGVHYPGDVLAGASIGLASAVATMWWWPRVTPQPPLAEHETWEEHFNDDAGGQLTIVVNNAAGLEGADSVSEQIQTELPGATARTRHPDQLAEAFTELPAETKAIGVAGGDGSLGVAADAAHARGLPLLVVPGGTLNRFAKDLGIETVRDATEAFHQGATASVDLAVVEHGDQRTTFCNGAALGSYPALVDLREKWEDTIGKWPALLMALIRLLRTDQPTDLIVNGERQSVWFLFVGNCRYEPGGFAPSMRQRLDDGVLDVRMVTANHRLARTRLLLSLITGRLGSSDIYSEWTTPELRIDIPRGSERLALDGETLDASGTLRIHKPQTLLPVYAAHPPAT